MSKVLLNFSGHTLSKEAKKELVKKFDKIESLFFDNINVSEDIDKQLKRILDKVKSPLDGSIPITIIPPGHSILAILLMSYLHAALGHFPNMCMLDLANQGVYLPCNIFYSNVNKLRTSGRIFRQELWERNNNEP